MLVVVVFSAVNVAWGQQTGEEASDEGAFMPAAETPTPTPSPTPIPTPVPTVTSVITRAAFGRDNAGYRLFEVYQTWGKGGWIFPDVGYIDFRTAKTYREFFIGGGKVLHDSEKLLAIGEIYFAQATGPAAQGATYYQPWALVKYKPTKRTSIEGVYFPYFPLNETATTQHVLERIKAEMDFGRFKAGGGYGGYKFGRDSWQHRPFGAFTWKTKNWGSFEVWGQKISNGFQAQFRHHIDF